MSRQAQQLSGDLKKALQACVNPVTVLAGSGKFTFSTWLLPVPMAIIELIYTE
jgi:hypothetical protein